MKLIGRLPERSTMLAAAYKVTISHNIPGVPGDSGDIT